MLHTFCSNQLGSCCLLYLTKDTTIATSLSCCITAPSNDMHYGHGNKLMTYTPALACF